MAKYDKKTVERICQLISTDSYTIAEVCRIAGIGETTYHRWMSEKREFRECIKKAENDFDSLVISEAKKSLMKKIRGYTEQEKKTVTVDTGKRDENDKPIVRVKEHTVTDRHYQPDTAAIIFALTNRDPANWKNRINGELTGKDGKDLFSGRTVEELEAELRETVSRIE